MRAHVRGAAAFAALALVFRAPAFAADSPVYNGGAIRCKPYTP